MRRLTTVVASFLAIIFVLSGSAAAKSGVKKGVCAIVAGATSHSKYATVKCYLNNNPGNYVIRNTVFERDDKKKYRDIARFAGQKMKCDFTKTGTKRGGGILITHYELSNCR